jgi:hypothetical protein
LTAFIVVGMLAVAATVLFPLVSLGGLLVGRFLRSRIAAAIAQMSAYDANRLGAFAIVTAAAMGAVVTVLTSLITR